MANLREWAPTKQEILDSGLYSKELWSLVEEFAEDLLVQGRVDFDVPHTHGVVYWACQIAVAYNEESKETEGMEEIDLTVLVTTAWLHDIGYYGQFDEVADLTAVSGKKAMHMVTGARMAREFLEENAAQLLSSAQIDQIVLLISIHDDLDKISTLLESMFVEADTLGMMDVEWVDPTYKRIKAFEFPDRVRSAKRFNTFKTKLGKAVLPGVIERFRQRIIDRDLNGVDPRE